MTTATTPDLPVLTLIRISRNRVDQLEGPRVLSFDGYHIEVDVDGRRYHGVIGQGTGRVYLVGSRKGPRAFLNHADWIEVHGSTPTSKIQRASDALAEIFGA